MVLPGASCTVSVTFRRSTTSTSVRSATLTVSSNDPDTPQARVALYAMRAPACTYSVSPLSQSVSAQAATGSAGVSTASGCAWTASANASWISITAGSGGTGNGTVNYSVSANTTTTSRTGTMTIARQTFTVTQQGQICAYTISPTNSNIAASATTGSVSVTCGSGCTWTASSNASWITSPQVPVATGNGTVSYSVSANTTTTSRTGTMTIAGQTFTVSQAAGTQVCTYSISPPVSPSALCWCRKRFGHSTKRLRLDCSNQCLLDQHHGGKRWDREWDGKLFGGGKHRHVVEDGHAHHRRPDRHGQPAGTGLRVHDFTDQCFLRCGRTGGYGLSHVRKRLHVDRFKQRHLDRPCPQ